MIPPNLDLFEKYFSFLRERGIPLNVILACINTTFLVHSPLTAYLHATNKRACPFCLERLPEGTRNNRVYCSDRCRTAYHSLSFSTLSDLIRRKLHMCQHCHTRLFSEELEIHQIYPRQVLSLVCEKPQVREDEELYFRFRSFEFVGQNLVCLCKRCHRVTFTQTYLEKAAHAVGQNITPQLFWGSFWEELSLNQNPLDSFFV